MCVDLLCGNCRKDDICFRRKKVKNVEAKDATTQSRISCKPFLNYELKRLDDGEKLCEKPIEPIHVRRDENHTNHTNNPFSLKSKENHEIKSSHSKNADKISSHRRPSRHANDQISLHNKHTTNHRPKENERREQIDVERSKRKRSPSESKDNKRIRRSRSRSRSKRERKRNAHEKNSPAKVSRKLVCRCLY